MLCGLQRPNQGHSWCRNGLSILLGKVAPPLERAKERISMYMEDEFSYQDHIDCQSWEALVFNRGTGKIIETVKKSQVCFLWNTAVTFYPSIRISLASTLTLEKFFIYHWNLYTYQKQHYRHYYARYNNGGEVSEFWDVWNVYMDRQKQNLHNIESF